MERLPATQIKIVPAGDGPTRAIAGTKCCAICEQLPSADEVVIIIQDLDPGRPGIHETVLHKTCLEALVAATSTITTQDEFVLSAIGPHGNN